MSFGEKLNELLKERKINALTLAKEIGVPKSIVYEWKSGIREPGMAQLRKLSDYFGIGILSLIGQEEKTSAETDEKMTVLLRQAKKLSPEEYSELVESFRRNLNSYLAARDDAD